MTTARQLMSLTTATTTPDETVCQAAQTMRDRRVGELAVCESGELTGVLTDRDIVVLCVAAGKDPRSTRVAALPPREAWSVDADDSAEAALHVLIEHAARSLPVTERGRLVGTLTQVDVAGSLSPATIRRVLAELR